MHEEQPTIKLGPGDVIRFVSRRHPGPSPWQWVFAVALVRPLTLCLLPLMIAALIAVLQGFPALLYLTIGFPAALLAASAWTVYQMMTTTAAVLVRPGFAAMQSVWDVVLRKRTMTWLPILDLRTNPTHLILGLGDASYVLDRTEWPNADALLDTLRTARAAYPKVEV